MKVICCYIECDHNEKGMCMKDVIILDEAEYDEHYMRFICLDASLVRDTAQKEEGESPK